MENLIIKKLERSTKPNDAMSYFYFDYELDIDYNQSKEVVELQKQIKELQSRANKVKERISLNLDKIDEIKKQRQELVSIQIDVTLNKHSKQSRELAEQIKDIEGDNFYSNDVLREINTKIREYESELMSSKYSYNELLYSEQLEQGKVDVINFIKSIESLQHQILNVIKRVRNINSIPEQGHNLSGTSYDLTSVWNNHITELNPKLDELIRKFNINTKELENE